MAQYFNMPSAGLNAVGSGYFKQEPHKLGRSAGNRPVSKDTGGMSPEMIQYLSQMASKAITQDIAEESTVEAAREGKQKAELQLSIIESLRSGDSLSEEQSQYMANTQADVDAYDAIINEQGGDESFTQSVSNWWDEQDFGFGGSSSGGMGGLGSSSYRNHR